MGTSTPRATRVPASVVVVGLALSVAVLLLGSVRFARLDWTGLSFERAPVTSERVVSDTCTERIRPYTTETGRVIEPVTVDEQQYLSMVDHLRGTPRDELHVDCLLDPFASRPAVPWLAHWLPFDEGVSIALVNLSMVLLATWSTILVLAAQRRSGAQIAAVGASFAVAWNTFMFGSTLLVDAAAVGLASLCWLLLVKRRWWWVWPVLVLASPVRETVAVVVLPVMAVQVLAAWRRDRRVATVAPFVAAVVASGASFVAGRALFIEPDATWDLTPSVGAFVNNLFEPLGIATFLIGTVPLYVPALAVIRQRARRSSWAAQLTDPATMGVAVTIVLCLWVTLSADLSARFAWVGFPFAASLAAQWWSQGRPAQLLDRSPLSGLDRGRLAGSTAAPGGQP